MEKKSLRNLLLFVLFSFLVFSQPAQIISQSSVSQVTETTISSASYISDVNVAHITSPTTFPIHNEWKADPVFPPVQKIVYQIIPIPYLFQCLIDSTESAGFIDVKKYHSNYLP